MNNVIAKRWMHFKNIQLMFWTVALRLCAICVLLISFQAISSPLIPAYPNANIELSIEEDRQNFPIIMDRMKKVNGIVTSNASLLLDGNLKRSLYYLPPGHSSEQGFNFYVNLMQNQGVEAIFKCQSFSCGASNFWANDVFKIPMLYGQDNEQAFYIGKKEGHYYTVYSVRRGNRRVYTLVDIFMPDGTVLAKDLPENSVPKNRRRFIITARDIIKNTHLSSFLDEMVDDSTIKTLFIINRPMPKTSADFDASESNMKLLKRAMLNYLREKEIDESRFRFSIAVSDVDLPAALDKDEILLDIIVMD